METITSQQKTTIDCILNYWPALKGAGQFGVKLPWSELFYVNNKLPFLPRGALNCELSIPSVLVGPANFAVTALEIMLTNKVTETFLSAVGQAMSVEGEEVIEGRSSERSYETYSKLCSEILLRHGLSKAKQVGEYSHLQHPFIPKMAIPDVRLCRREYLFLGNSSIMGTIEIEQLVGLSYDDIFKGDKLTLPEDVYRVTMTIHDKLIKTVQLK